MSMPAEQVTSDMNLADLLQGYADAPPLRICGVASDSRMLDQGFLFLACQGSRSHGIEYAAEAVAAGAVVIEFCDWDRLEVVPMLLSSEPRKTVHDEMGLVYSVDAPQKLEKLIVDLENDGELFERIRQNQQAALNRKLDSEMHAGELVYEYLSTTPRP